MSGKLVLQRHCEERGQHLRYVAPPLGYMGMRKIKAETNEDGRDEKSSIETSGCNVVLQRLGQPERKRLDSLTYCIHHPLHLRLMKKLKMVPTAPPNKLVSTTFKR